MKVWLTENIKGGEVLAKSIYKKNYTELLAKGTVLRKEYIQRLREYGIKEIYIEDDGLEEKNSGILAGEVKEYIKDKVKNILERHTYQQNEELLELCATADHIIENILNEEKVAEKIYDIKERSADIYEHSISVCSLATLLGLKLGYGQEKIHDVAVGALLHDLGLRYLPFDYVDKDISSMSKLEQAEYRKHPIYAYSSLVNENWISKTSKNILLCHHEALDGSGYPLRASNISEECRLIAVCDSFDERICGIGCERVKVYAAIEYLKLFSGLKFDANIVKLFLQFVAVYPVGTKVITNEGEVACIVGQNKGFPERPILRILENSKGEPVKEEIIKDLLQYYKIFIDQVLN